MPKEENKKRSIFTKILIALGVASIVIVLLIIALVGYLVIANPFGVDITKVPSAILNIGEGESTYDHPLLDEEQEVFLESIGVDTRELPTEITEEQADCSEEALGEERVNEILLGSPPSPSDYFKAKHCF